jgi:nucleoside-diphosphate-sugar epimerase
LQALVAGGAGFIGSHIVDRLLEKNIEVTVLDNLSTGYLENIEHCRANAKFQFIHGDIRDLILVRRIVKNVDVVFNEAALTSVSRSMKNPIEVNEVNVGGTLNLLEACINSKVQRFIHASSASIYGNPKTLPLTENSSPNPISPYAVAKLAAENYVQTFNLAYGLKTVCLRYFNVYGPKQALNVYSGAIRIFLDKLCRDQRPVIFGDGNQTRDFVYVEDVVEASMLALNNKKTVGEIFNIATGKPRTINDLVRTLQERLGKQHLKPIHRRPRQGDIRYSYANIKKAERILGYKPEFSLEKGIDRLVDRLSEVRLK